MGNWALPWETFDNAKANVLKQDRGERVYYCGLKGNTKNIGIL